MSGLVITLKHDGREFGQWPVSDLRALGVVPNDVIGAAVKRSARADITRVAEDYRARLATKCAGKLAAYRIKEDIARDPDKSDPAEMALIEREATARGMTTEALIANINSQASAYRQTALLVEVLEVEAKAAIAAVADDAVDIEDQVQDALDAAQAQAEAAFEEALELMNET